MIVLFATTQRSREFRQKKVALEKPPTQVSREPPNLGVPLRLLVAKGRHSGSIGKPASFWVNWSLTSGAISAPVYMESILKIRLRVQSESALGLAQVIYASPNVLQNVPQRRELDHCTDMHRLPSAMAGTRWRVSCIGCYPTFLVLMQLCNNLCTVSFVVVEVMETSSR